MEVTAASFETEVMEASKSIPVVADFWAPWCGPCRTLGPIIEKVAERYAGRVKLVKINSDENPDLSQAFGIRSIPTVIAFKDGRPAAHFLGALPEAEVSEFFEQLLPSAAEEALARAAAEGPSEAELLAKLAADPGDHEARLALATFYAGQRRYAQAMDGLLEIVRREKNWRDGEARKQLVTLFNIAASEPELVAQYRRKLASTLH
jgi:putative thioredoxin